MNERFTTLDQVVRDICEIGGGDLDHKSYGRVLKICVNELRSYNLFNSTPYTKTVECEVLPNNTVRLPNNALDILMVGVDNRCGIIEEIFYNKNLSMDKKHIEECCECEGRVQIMETISEGTGEELCNYTVEGIDLGGGQICNYSIYPASPSGNWMKYTFAEVMTWEGSFSGTGIYIKDGLVDNSLLNLYLLSASTLNSLATFDGVTYTLLGKDVASAIYDLYVANINPKRYMELDNRSILFPKDNTYPLTAFVVQIYNLARTPSLASEWVTYKTLTNNITDYSVAPNYTSKIFIDNLSLSLDLYVNINGSYVLIDPNEIINNVWQRNDSTDIITTYEFRNTDTQSIILSGDVDAVCEGGDSKSFEVLINGGWVDKTNEVTEQGTWELLNTTDIVTAWRYVSEGTPEEPTPIVGDCRIDLYEREVAKYVTKEITCDKNNKCHDCGKTVQLYTSDYHGGWYGYGNLYGRILAQSNLNLPNSGQVYFENYTQRPYPARWGFYNIDLAKGVIRLSHTFAHEHEHKVVITYSTDMVEVEGAKVVAVEWFNMLLYRCKELIWSNRSVDSHRQRELYERERTRIMRIYNKETMEEWKRGISNVKFSGVKR